MHGALHGVKKHLHTPLFIYCDAFYRNAHGGQISLVVI